jgi:uncharacterized protein YdaU (DUF1376 family)
MNFYPFHVGDYAAHTKHLSLMEDLAYRRLLDYYYLSEGELPTDPVKVARLIGMREYVKEVSDVLSDFFLISDQGYKNKRCDAEIFKYREKADRAVKANKSRWKSDSDLKSDTTSYVKSDMKSDLKSDADHIPTKNQEPRTINQEPLTNKKKRHNTTTASSPGVASLEAEACQVLKWSGIGSVNPQHPELIALCQAGAKPPDFQEAGRIAVDKGKGFAYALGIVKSKMVEKNTETPYQKSVRERVAEFAPGVAKQNIEVINVIAA